MPSAHDASFWHYKLVVEVSASNLHATCTLDASFWHHKSGAFVGGPTTSPGKSKMADGSHIEFHKNANISVLDEDICTQFCTKIQQRADWIGQQQQDGFQPTT